MTRCEVEANSVLEGRVRLVVKIDADVRLLQQVIERVCVQPMCDVKKVVSVLQGQQEALSMLGRTTHEDASGRPSGWANRSEVAIMYRKRHRPPEFEPRLRDRLAEHGIEADDAIKTSCIDGG